MRPICSLTYQILFVVCSFTSLPALRADTILFSDLTDVLTVTTSNPTRMPASPCVIDRTNCQVSCVSVAARSATATIINLRPTPLTQAVTPGGNFIFMREPGIYSISDVIRIDSTLPGAGTTVTFGSDIDPSVF